MLQPSSRMQPLALGLLGVALLALNGCAFLRGSAEGTAFVVDDMRQLHLTGTDDPDTRAIAFRGPFEIQEYTRSRATGRSEAIYIRTRGTGTALDLTPADLTALNRRWVFNAAADRIEWQTPRAVRAQATNARYRPYRRHADDEVRNCMAFVHTWDHESQDPLFRPGQGYFGYHCVPVGEPLDTGRIERFLKRIEIADVDVPGFYIGQRVPRDADALSLAAGRDKAGWGIDGFPLHRTRHFPIGAAYSNGGG